MSQAETRVSVIIPNFNHAQYVGEAIKSVLNQEFSDYEIIVVDDGSTDNSREVISRFGERVRCIWQENRGLSAARNTGIQIAKGEYIGVLDADDMYESDFMSALVPILNANPDLAAVYCGYQFVDQSNRPLPQKEIRLVPEDRLYQALVDGNFLVPESILVRRRCYQEVGLFDEKLRALEDFDMWLRIAKQFNISGVTRTLTRHRILVNSMSSDPNRQTQNRLAVIQKHFGGKPANDAEWTESKRRAYGQAYLASAVEYLQAHDLVRAYSCFLELAQTNPRLLTLTNTFYELGCGEQPKGFRGDFESLNIEHNAQVLLNMLDRLFNEPDLNNIVEPIRKQAYANAYFSLSLQAYGARQLKTARDFMHRSVLADPGYLLNRRLVSIYIKSLLGAKTLNWLKNKHLRFSFARFRLSSDRRI